MKRNIFPSRYLAILSLLFSMLFLPMLHIHPEYEHAHGEVADHQHQSAVHADFFPKATHGHGHHDDHDRHQHQQGFGVTINASHHTLLQIDLFSVHIGEFFRRLAGFKNNPAILNQGSAELSLPLYVQALFSGEEAVFISQRPHFSKPSLRAPPFFT